MSSLKILLISTYPLLTHLLNRVSESFTRPLEIRTVLVPQASQFDPKIAMVLDLDLILLWLIFPTAESILLIQSLRAAGVETPVLLACFQEAIPALSELEDSQVQGLTSSAVSFEELETAIYAVAEGYAADLLVCYL